MTPEEGEKLALSATEGKLQLALRNYTDTEDVMTRGTTIPNLLSSYAGAGPEKKDTGARRAAPAEPQRVHGGIDQGQQGQRSEIFQGG